MHRIACKMVMKYLPKEITKNILYQYAGFVITAGLSFLLSIFLARNLPPENFGYFITATSAGAVLTVLIEWGCRAIIQREAFSSSNDSTKSLEKLRLYFGQTIVVSLLLFLSGCLIFSYSKTLILATVLVFWLVVITQMRSAYLRGNSYFVFDSVHMVGSRLTSAAIIVFFVLLGTENTSLILFSWASGLLIWLILSGSTREFFPPIFNQSSLKTAGTIILFIELFNAVTFRFDLLFAQYIKHDPEEIAYYGASLRLIEGLVFLAVPFKAFLLNNYRKDQNLGKLSLNNLFTSVFISVLVATVLSILIWLNSQIIILFIYGPDYVNSSIYLKKLVFILPPMFGTIPLVEWILAREYEKFYLFLSSLICILTIVIFSYFLTISQLRNILYLKVGVEILLFCGLLVFILALVRKSLLQGSE